MAALDMLFQFLSTNPLCKCISTFTCRVPAAAVSIEVDGVYQAMTKTVDNYWLADSSSYTFPTSVQVTSVLGDTVTDVVNVASPSGAVVGAAQFPLSSSYDVVGGTPSHLTYHCLHLCVPCWFTHSICQPQQDA